MNIVLLSPYFPTNYYNFAVALRQNGVNVLGLGDTPYDQLRPELRDALTEYFSVDDLHDYDQLVRACGYFTHRYGKLDRIESHNEYWLETDARLRTDFNILGPKNDDIRVGEAEVEDEAVFVKAGIDVARGRVVRIFAAAVDRFIPEVGYPVVAKPDIGVGAAATYKIQERSTIWPASSRRNPRWITLWRNSSPARFTRSMVWSIRTGVSSSIRHISSVRVLWKPSTTIWTSSTTRCAIFRRVGGCGPSNGRGFQAARALLPH